MKGETKDILEQNKVFSWIVLGTLLLLTIPLLLMKFEVPLYDPGSGYEIVNWSPFDFAVMGVLIFTTASAFVLIARKVDKRYRVAIAIATLAGFLWIWAELAVGVFTNWGS